MMPAIELKNINKYFGRDLGRVHVLKDLNFAAEPGELVLILGPSGSGKSTFLTIAGGLQTADSGEVYVDDHPVAKMNRKALEKMRLNQIGFVLQAYNLVPYLTVAEQFELVDRVRKQGNLSAAELDQLLADLDISRLKNQYPDQLSGGQQQRVAIARALYTNPAIILADEPTASLDSERVKEVGQLLANLAHDKQRAIVVVTHDDRLQPYADRTYRLVDGELV